MQSESPFFLLTEDVDGNVSYCWWDNEEGLQEDAVERGGAGERIICAIEISSCRDVEIPPVYTVDDFIEKVNKVYDEALRIYPIFQLKYGQMQRKYFTSMMRRKDFSVQDSISCLKI